MSDICSHPNLETVCMNDSQAVLYCPVCKETVNIPAPSRENREDDRQILEEILPGWAK